MSRKRASPLATRQATQDEAPAPTDDQNATQNKTEDDASALAPIQSKRPRVSGSLLFALAYVALLAAAFALRFYHVDMPPVDYPTDRQQWNARIAVGMAAGNSLFPRGHGWLELMIHPWLYGHSLWLARRLGLELWTWGRLWSVLFGTLTVGLAPWAIGWPTAWNDPARRRRVGLLFMAAMAFNPFHVFLSRLLTTEPVTLFLQMATLAAFWRYWRRPDRAPRLAIFVVLFVLSGWAKLPSLIWAPGLGLYCIFDRRVPARRRAMTLAALAVAFCCVFAFFRINPFKTFSVFEKDYPTFANQFLQWKDNVIWKKAFLGIVLLMTTIPGAILAVVGAFCAPPLYVMTLLTFLGLFYGLVNLNTYNFCHAIIPSMALAAWGVDGMLEAAGGWFRRQSAWLGRPAAQAWASRAWQGCCLALVAGLVAVLSKANPPLPQGSNPRGDVLEAAKVAQRLVPPGQAVLDDDGEGSFGFMLGRGLRRAGASPTGNEYFMSFQRYDPARLLPNVAKAWPLWSSLPGEQDGVLFGPAPPASGALADCLKARFDAPPGAPLSIAEAWLPKDRVDQAGKRLVAHPGDAFKIGIVWHNPSHARLAFMTWSNEVIGQALPLPVRQGGAAFANGAILRLPMDDRQVAVYEIEIPSFYPVGQCTLIYSAIADLANYAAPAQRGNFPVPVSIEPTPNQIAQKSIDRPFAELYPGIYHCAPDLWTENRFFRDMRVEGYTIYRPSSYYFSTPARSPGEYRLTLRGSAYPITQSDSPALDWPKVEVVLHGAAEQDAGEIAIAAFKDQEFSLEFKADAPFDAVELRVSLIQARLGLIPAWFTIFDPHSYAFHYSGQQVALMREARLELAGVQGAP
jgi:hypothetical protein